MKRVFPFLMMVTILVLSMGRPVFAGVQSLPILSESRPHALAENRLNNLVTEADLIITGTVTGKGSYWNLNSTAIFTDVFFTVEKVIKGDISLPTIKVVVEGGQVGDISLDIPGYPDFSVNKKALLFLNQQDENKYVPTGWQNGIFMVNGEFIDTDTSLSRFIEQIRQIMVNTGIPIPSTAGSSGQEPVTGVIPQAATVAVSSGTAPSVTGIIPSSGSAGTNTQVIIYGAGFGDTQGAGKVTFFYKDNQPRIQAVINYWSDTRIVATIPVGTINGYDASASSGQVLVSTSAGDSNAYMYGVSFSYGGQKWSAVSPVVHFRVNPNIPGAANTEAAMQAAAQAWNNVSEVDFQFAYDGVTGSSDAAFNGVNELLGGDLGASGPVANTTLWHDTSNNMLEFDIEFNTSLSWSTNGDAGAFDLQSVATHELGHAAGFRDLYGKSSGASDENKMTYGRIGTEQIKRNLAIEDQRGIRWIYPANPVIKLGEGGFGTAAIGVNPITNRIYSGNSRSNNVTVIDGSTNDIITTINVGSGPQGLAVNPDTNRIYVANTYNNSVSVIDGASNVVVAVISTGSLPFRLGINPTTNRIYTANYGSNTVTVIDGAINTVIATVNVGSGPSGIGVNPVTNLIYVSNDASNNVSVINGVNNTVVTTIYVGSGPGGLAVNPTTNRIYVPNYGSNTVSVIDGVSGNITATPEVGVAPRGVAVNTASNRIYVANSASNSVSVIDGITSSVTDTFEAGNEPFGIGLNENTNRIYVADYQSNAISVINGGDNSLVVTIKTGRGPDALEVNTNSNRIYAASSGDNSIAVIDGFSNNIVSTIKVGSSPTGAAVDTNTNRIYAACSGNNTVWVIDGVSNTVISTVNAGNRPTGIAVNSSTKRIYVTNNGGSTVSVIDGTSNSEVALVDVGVLPIGIGINPLTNRIYAANNASNTVSVIDGASNSVVTTVNVGKWPYGVKVNPATNRIYITNDGGNTVSVIDGLNNTVVSTIKVGLSPRGITLNTDTNRIYVANSGNGCVSVIDGGSNLVVATHNVGKGPRSIAVNPATNLIYVTAFWADNLAIIQDTTPTPGVATQLSFSTQPGTESAAGMNFAVQPILAVKDANSDIVADSSSAVTLNITAGTGKSGAVLNGATTVQAVNGVALFAGLSINLAGMGYTLTASSGNLTEAVSSIFKVVHPGDANGDGEVNMGDVTRVERVILGLDPNTSGCDANSDGNVNMGDATKIERIILWLDPLVG